MGMEAYWPITEKGKPIPLHKERKIALHSTVKGKGKVAKALEVKR